MVKKLHTIIREESAVGYPPLLGWVDEKPIWITRYMLLSGDPHLEDYLGANQLDWLKQSLHEAGTKYATEHVLGYYDLHPSPAGHLQVVERYPVDFHSVMGLHKQLIEAREGEELILDIRNTFRGNGREHYRLSPKKKSEMVPEKIFLRKEHIDYLQKTFPSLAEREVRYHANGVFFFPDQNTIAALARCNVPDVH